MVSKGFLAIVCILATQLAPLPALALGGSKSDATPPTQGAAPGDLSNLQPCTTPPAPGEDAVCSCAPARVAKSVWGTGPFTADSDICTAARFTGAVGAEGGAVHLSGLPGLEKYEGGKANGVTTHDWGAFSTSFGVEPVATGPIAASAPDLAQCGRMPAGVDVYDCACQGSEAESRASVWGADPFTADSAICAAALFLGYIEAGKPANVHVLRAPGLEAYEGDSSNGVSTAKWGAFDSSIVFDWNR